MQFAYISGDDADISFNFEKYTQINQNEVFELSVPSSKIRFAACLITHGAANPTILHDFAVQLEAGAANLKLMSLPIAY